MTKYKNSRIFLFLAGALSILLSLFLIFIPFEDYSSNIKIMSMAFVLIGLMYVLYFVLNKKWHFKPGWTLSQGFYVIIMGVICFFTYNNELSDSLGLVFAFWSLSSGSTQIAASIKLRSLEFSKWYRILIAGFVNLIFAAMFIIEPFSQFMSVYVSYGIYIFISGLICISELFSY